MQSTRSADRRTAVLRQDDLVPYAWDIVYGPESAAQPGMVMLRIHRGPEIIVELNMPPLEYLGFVKGVNKVAKGITGKRVR